MPHETKTIEGIRELSTAISNHKKGKGAITGRALRRAGDKLYKDDTTRAEVSEEARAASHGVRDILFSRETKNLPVGKKIDAICTELAKQVDTIAGYNGDRDVITAEEQWRILDMPKTDLARLVEDAHAQALLDNQALDAMEAVPGVKATPRNVKQNSQGK